MQPVICVYVCCSVSPFIPAHQSCTAICSTCSSVRSLLVFPLPTKVSSTCTPACCCCLLPGGHIDPWRVLVAFVILPVFVRLRAPPTPWAQPPHSCGASAALWLPLISARLHSPCVHVHRWRPEMGASSQSQAGELQEHCSNNACQCNVKVI